MTAITLDNPIRRASSEWLRANEPVIRALIAANPELTFGELQAQTGWSDWQVNNMTSYLQNLGEE